MKAVILCDDVLSLKKVINSIDAIDNVELVKTFTGITKVDEFVSINDIDVIFIDVTTLKRRKIELIKNIKRIGKTVFTVLISDNKEDSLLAYNLHAVGFLLKPLDESSIYKEIENIKFIAPQLTKKIEIKTFGNFSVLVNGKPVHFQIKKAKEILAYLVNKQGTQVNWPTLSAEVLEEDSYDKKIQNRLHRDIESLKYTLRQYEIEEILSTSKGYLSINCETFKCDLYEFLKGDEIAKNFYSGEYMYEYSWAAYRTAYLDNIINIQK